MAKFLIFLIVLTSSVIAGVLCAMAILDDSGTAFLLCLCAIGVSLLGVNVIER